MIVPELGELLILPQLIRELVMKRRRPLSQRPQSKFHRGVEYQGILKQKLC
jgi:hypothetical protein